MHYTKELKGLSKKELEMFDAVDLTTEEESTRRSIETETIDEIQCRKCEYKNLNKDDVEAHSALAHGLICDECDLKFDDKSSVEKHISDVHDKRGAKRHSHDKSLVFDPRTCQDCKPSKIEIQNMSEVIIVLKEELT